MPAVQWPVGAVENLKNPALMAGLAIKASLACRIVSVRRNAIQGREATKILPRHGPKAMRLAATDGFGYLSTFCGRENSPPEADRRTGRLEGAAVEPAPMAI
ncbi:MAG: hypothetical protein V2L15_05190 [Desulfobacteraceae bacterium]|jgi:hypothetical protein|nr:hypothetical protein [Desulfobacteraceae bacterium]